MMRLICFVTCLTYCPCAALFHSQHGSILFAHNCHVKQNGMLRGIQHSFFCDITPIVASSKKLFISPFASQPIQNQPAHIQNGIYLRGPSGDAGNIDDEDLRKYARPSMINFLNLIATWTAAMVISLSSIKVS